MDNSYDIIVIGAGHAGCEAAYASARMGCSTLLLTMNLDHIALMSCNPAIGGLAKGHLVREIDALGGLMGIAADQTGIQFRMLNTSKGPAVRAPRAQSDKRQYNTWVKQFLENIPNLELRQGTVEKIIYDRSGSTPIVSGVELQYGSRINCNALIVTTGTFLDGLIHIGANSYPAGRAGECSADSLSRSFGDIGLTTGRLKTGTPPRLDRKSINWDILEPQHGDDPASPFSFLTRSFPMRQVPCYITYTNEQTHDIIRGNLNESALFSGRISSVGPRYCPSIEDKCVRFAEKDRHQLFLEPEGLQTNEIYVNGVSTSLPERVQQAFIRSIVGLEKAQMTRVGYAIEYTFVPPSQIGMTLETKSAQGLYLAGQINGTTGYEEAAAQGLVAGVNAVLKLRGQEPFSLRRDEAYIGVLIDDLVTKEHREPYRMFTSRAEYRLLLRQDNADLRLGHYAHRLGLISDDRYRKLESYEQAINGEIKRLKATPVKSSALPPDVAAEFDLDNLPSAVKASQVLARPEVEYGDLYRLGLGNAELNDSEDLVKVKVREQVELAIKYEGYIARQRAQVLRQEKFETMAMPQDLDYGAVRGLTNEARQKLAAMRPETIGQAGRIAGVNPADINVLMIHLRAQENAA